MHAQMALAAIAGFLFASLSFAQSASYVSQDRAAKMDRHFAYTDKNGNGFIGRDEATRYPVLIKHFNIIDSNEDGNLSREEMQVYRLGTPRKQRKARPEQKVTAAENNGNDALTKADDSDASPGQRKNF
jgi:Ca2+-binding EF-hand superfamily protein